MLRRFAALLLICSLAFAVSVKADEQPVPTGPLIIPVDSSKANPVDLSAAPSSKAAFNKSTPAVRVAMCGVEADAGNADLDAGLIDFKTPDPHAVGRLSDDTPQAGRNVPDYRASVFLGLTLGYHF
jgi:hypothetical protein